MMTWDSWLKDWYEKEKRCHSGVGRGSGGKTQNQPSTLWLTINNLESQFPFSQGHGKAEFLSYQLCFISLWDTKSFCESVSLPFIGQKMIVWLEPLKTQRRLFEGDAHLSSSHFILGRTRVPVLLVTDRCLAVLMEPARCATAPCIAPLE